MILDGRMQRCKDSQHMSLRLFILVDVHVEGNACYQCHHGALFSGYSLPKHIFQYSDLDTFSHIPQASY